MSQEFFKNPDGESGRQNRRRRIADFLVGVALGTTSIFLIKNFYSADPLSLEKTLSAVGGIGCAAGSITLLGSSILNLRGRGDEGNGGGWGFDGDNPLIPSDDPDGMRITQGILTVEDIISTPQSSEILEKVH